MSHECPVGTAGRDDSLIDIASKSCSSGKRRSEVTLSRVSPKNSCQPSVLRARGNRTTGTALQPEKNQNIARPLRGVPIPVGLVLGWMLRRENKVKEGATYVVGSEVYLHGYSLVMMSDTREVPTAASTSGQYSAPI